MKWGFSFRNGFLVLSCFAALILAVPGAGAQLLQGTIDDPKAYTKPWKSVTVHFKLLPDTELIEHICENEKDAPHLVGK